MLIIFLTFEFRVVPGRTLFYAGPKKTSPAFAFAFGNLIPSMTFIFIMQFLMFSFFFFYYSVGDTIFNNLEKNANHICAIIPK
jgi:hypothetical protein